MTIPHHIALPSLDAILTPLLLIEEGEHENARADQVAFTVNVARELSV